MTNYWVLVVKDHQHLGRTVPATTILMNRVKYKFWSLNKRTPNIKRIRPGDRVVFYVSSYVGKGFAGTATIASYPHPITPEQKFHVFGMPSEKFNYSIELEEPILWTKLLEPPEIIGHVSFITSRDKWWAWFRGSIKRITEEDYNTIVMLGSANK